MKFRKLITSALAAMLAVSVTACGSSSGSDTPAQSTAETAVSEMNIVSSDNLSETSEIRETLNIGYSSIWESLTPFRTNANNKNLYSYALYETLAKKTAEGEYIPWTAKSWTMHEDGVTCDVELFGNITDSNGNHITAEDVVWFLNESALRGLKPSFTNLDTAEVTGDTTFTVTLKKDMYGSWEKILTDTFVFSRKELEASGDEFAMHPI
ncbi:MAG: hypothetical protein IJ130_11705, partial [Solobacterium sp.]|nr:hypothetical protein [Solobacterium sp.]